MRNRYERHDVKVSDTLTAVIDFICRPRTIRFGAFLSKQILININMETIDNFLEATKILVFILGIMALIYAGLCLINQKNNKW